MKRSHPEIARRSADHAFQPRLHFARSFVRERHGQDAIRRNVELAQQVRNAVREHARFSASGACKNQTRAIRMANGCGLYVVKGFGLQDHIPHIFDGAGKTASVLREAV
jgi:hypothetical protein